MLKLASYNKVRCNGYIVSFPDPTPYIRKIIWGLGMRLCDGKKNFDIEKLKQYAQNGAVEK